MVSKKILAYATVGVTAAVTVPSAFAATGDPAEMINEILDKGQTSATALLTWPVGLVLGFIAGIGFIALAITGYNKLTSKTSQMWGGN